MQHDRGSIWHPRTEGWRLALLLVIWPCLAACEARSSSAKAEDVASGVLFIVIDTLRADHVGAHNPGCDLTPNIDRLAGRSVVFERATAASSWTRPSIASMFTSQYPSAVGVTTTEDALAEEVDTLAERLGDLGFQCFGVTANRNAGEVWGFAQGFDVFASDLPRRAHSDGFGMVPAEEITKKALSLLEGRDQERPWFLFLHYADPHDPYMPHDDEGADPAPAGRYDGSREQLHALDKLSKAQRTQEDMDLIRHLYAGEVEYCDEWIGVLLDGLESDGLLAETLVILTADHGEGLWDHGLRAHGMDLYEEMIHVPFVVKYPASFEVAAGRVAAMVGHVDIAPTILRACGAQVPEDYQGEDLSRLSRPGTPWRRFGYSEMYANGIDLESIRDERAKLIRSRIFDGDKWRNRTHRVTVGDSLRKLSKVYFGSFAHVDEIVALNPELQAQGVPAAEIKLEIGMELRIPDRPREAEELMFMAFDLVLDEREIDDVATETMQETPLYRALEHVGRENSARAGQGKRLHLDELDQGMIDELRGLGYIDG